MNVNIKKSMVYTVITLFLLSSFMVAGLASATTNTAITLTTQSHGSAFWTLNGGVLPTQGGLGTTTFQSGDTIVFHAQPNSGYSFAGFYFYYANGSNFAQSFDLNTQITLPVNMPSFTIQAHYTVSVVAQYHMICTQDPNTYVSLAGTTLVNAGQSLTYYYSADTGYQLSSVVVDGANVAIVGYYTFTNIQKDHSITIHSISIPNSDVMLTFVNDSMGGISWTDYGQGPFPPLNPTIGGAGTFGFPVGENIQIQAFPNAIGGNVFDSIEIGYNGNPLTTFYYSPVLPLVVSQPMTFTAHFVYQPTTNYTVDVSSSGGGQLTWYDDTTSQSGGSGSHSFNIGDQVTFTATPYSGYFFKGMYSTFGLLGGHSMNQQAVLIMMEDFNISAVFSDSSLDYTAILHFDPTPLNYDLNDSTTNFVLDQSKTYTGTLILTDLSNDAIFGTYNISITHPNYNPAVVQDVGTPLLNVLNIDPTHNYATNNQWSIYFSATEPVYDAGGSYIQIITNQQYGSGQLQFNLATNGTFPQSVYQGLEISVFDQLNHKNFNTPLYTITWLTSSQALTYPTATPTPTTSTIPGGLGNITNLLWNTTTRLIYGCIVLAGLCLAALIAKLGISGLIFMGIIALVINVLAFQWSILTLFPVLLGIIYLIIAGLASSNKGGY